MNIKKSLIRNSVQATLALSAALARRERLHVATHALMTGMARLTIHMKGIRPADSLPELGRQWQRGFPSAKQVPITEVTDNTVYAEIHTPCPLRGSGDVHACYRMMQYDREVLRQAGGQFVVLSSQAEAGNRICKVAMRRAGEDVSDLLPAHQRAAQPSV